MVNRVKAEASSNGSVAVAEQHADSTHTLRPIRRNVVTLRIRGISPLIQHQWSEKAKEMMRSKHAGKKTKNRDVRDTQQEARDAAYYTQDGGYGVYVGSVKAAIIGAAHKDIGIEKTLVRKALFIRCRDRNNCVPLIGDEPEFKEDIVRVGNNAADLRYRPYFHNWAVELQFEVDAELLTTNDLITLIDRAGFGVGIGEWRPEKGGEFGRFQVDTDYPVNEESM